MTTGLPDVPPVAPPGLFDFLFALRRRVLDTQDATATVINNITQIINGGGGGGGSTLCPNLVVDFGGVGDGSTLNDAAFAAAEASPSTYIWVPEGTFKTTRLQVQFTKMYWGPGTIVSGDVTSGQNWVMPAEAQTYASTLAGHTGQGNSGWFSGDRTFSRDQWKVIGPLVKTYDTTQRYFNSGAFPSNIWFDIYSGNSGMQAELPLGATAGSTVITVNAAASTEWIGKQVAFMETSPFAVSSVGSTSLFKEIKTITAVAGNTFTISTPLTFNYPWNPGVGQFPSIAFSMRTFSSYEYIKVNGSGGGDNYGHIVRLQMRYQPKPTEYSVHMTACGGQYGGDVVFFSSGIRATGWESQYIDQGNDVGAIAQVDSFTRNNDTCPPRSGRVWLGCLLKSGGTRPIDAAYVYTGLTRVGLDLALAAMMETMQLTVGTSAGGTTLQVNNTNGAVIGEQIIIGDNNIYVGTITGFTTSTITVSPGTPGGIASGTIVKIPNGGAAISLARGHRIVWGSRADGNKRGGDPVGIHPVIYGNSLGDMFLETGNDGISDFIAMRFARSAGQDARFRLRPNQANLNTDLFSSKGITALHGLVATGGSGGIPQPTFYFGNSGLVYIQWNGANLRATKDGFNFVNIV